MNGKKAKRLRKLTLKAGELVGEAERTASTRGGTIVHIGPRMVYRKMKKAETLRPMLAPILKIKD